jgi:beta-glucosidase
MKGHKNNIEKLLEQLTLEEKAGQLNLLHGAVNAERDAVRAGAVSGYLLGPPRWDMGAAFSWAEEANSLQRIAVEESRMHIPLVFSRDVIHGHRTVFPIPLGQAASFDPTLVEECAEIAAREASAQGVHWNYSPMLDIGRDPRWGRVAEGYGEDPYLCTQMAGAVVHGYQGKDLSRRDRIAACAKHFVGYGAGEAGLDYGSVELSERTLQEVYLPPFRAAVAAGASSIMAALHDLNGIPMSANRRLLYDVLRTEWGFSGLIVSDWGAVADLLKHRVAEDEEQAVMLALQAGVEMDMVSGLFQKHLPRLVQEGKVSMELLDALVHRVLSFKASLGLFENPYVDPEREKVELLAPEHRAVARKAAEEAIILLENRNNLLPLSQELNSLAVVGPLAEARAELLGCWTLDGRAEDVVSPLEGIKTAAGQRTRIIADGTLPDAALARAQEAEVIIVVLGEHPTRSGEAASVSNIDLSCGQVELLAQLGQFGIPIVAVVIAGRALAIEPLRRYADAILYCFHPGVEGGMAIADIIFGKQSPSAKLPVTLPRSLGQVPIYYSRRSTGRPPQLDARYTTKYIDLPYTPLYPFGFGLSYSAFSYSNLSVTPEQALAEDHICVRVQVSNTGKTAASEVVQLYLRDEVRSVAPPQWELKGFQRVHLAPGAEDEVIFELRPEDFAFWHEGTAWASEAGVFTCRVGSNSSEGLIARFVLV